MLENYRPQVEIEVLKPDGSLLSRQSMNDDLIDPFPKSSTPGPEQESYFLDYLGKAALSTGS